MNVYRNGPCEMTWSVEMNCEDRTGNFEHITITRMVDARDEQHAVDKAFREAESAGFHVLAVTESRLVEVAVPASAGKVLS